MAHHIVKTVKNIGLILLQILTENLNAMLKNWGSDHILIPFYPKKTKLFFSFRYNYFNHTRHDLRNEQLIRPNHSWMQRAVNTRKLCSMWQSSQVIPLSCQQQVPALRQATYFIPCRSLGHCYIWFAHPELSLTMQALSFGDVLLITLVFKKIVLFVCLHCRLCTSSLKVHTFANTSSYHERRETQALWLERCRQSHGTILVMLPLPLQVHLTTLLTMLQLYNIFPFTRLPLLVAAWPAGRFCSMSNV